MARPRIAAYGVPGDIDVGVDITITPPVELLLKDLALLEGRLNRPGEALERAVNEVVIPSFKETWEAEGRPDPWEELSPYTIERKTGYGAEASYAPGSPKAQLAASRRGAISILISTPRQQKWGKHKRKGNPGDLKRQATSLEIWTFTKDTAFISGAGLYFDAPMHQQGTNNEPPRPFLILQFEDLNKIEEVFADWVNEQGLKFSAGI